MSRLKKELKYMWANVWFRSLVELLLIAIGAMMFMLLIQTSDQGRQAIQQVKQLMGYPAGF